MKRQTEGEREKIEREIEKARERERENIVHNKI